MGHKVQPTGFRLGITEEWRSRWYADKNYAETLGNDLAIRSYLEKRLAKAALSRVDIERAGDKVKVTIYTARPGIVIGKKGADIDVLRSDLEKVANVAKGQIAVDVVEIKRPELDANLVAQSVAEQLFQAKTDGTDLSSLVSSSVSSTQLQEISDSLPIGADVEITGCDRAMTESTVYATAALAGSGEQSYTIELVRDGIGWKGSAVDVSYLSEDSSSSTTD